MSTYYMRRSFPPSDERRTEFVRFSVSPVEKANLQSHVVAQGRPAAELLRIAAEPLLSVPEADSGPSQAGPGTGRVRRP